MGFDRNARLIALIALVALIARLCVVAADNDYTPAHDAFDYDRHATSIAAGDGFPPSGYEVGGGPSALRAPAYPYALGATYALFGVEADGGRILNVALGVLAVLLVIALASRLAGSRVGLIAGFLAAVFPPLVLLSRDLYSESLFIPLVLLTALAALRFRDEGRTRWVVAVGALLGLIALTRNPGPALLLPALIGVWAIRPRISWQSLRMPLLALVVAALVVLPWTLRNAVEFGRLIPVTTSTGFALAGTYNEEAEQDQSYSASWRTPSTVPELSPLFTTPGIDEGTLDARLRDEATEFIRGHPLYTLEVAWHNGLRLFQIEDGSVVDPSTGPVEMRGIGSGATLAESVALIVLAPFALAGAFILVLRWRRSREAGASREPGPRLTATGFVWLFPLLILLSAALVAGLPRYRIPADPFFLILAAVAIEAAVRALLRRRRARQAPSGPGQPQRRGPALSAMTALAVAGCLTVAGCGSSDQPEPATTTGAADTGEISKEQFIARADKICAASLQDTVDLVSDVLSSDLSSSSGSDETTETLVKPGLEIRRKLARQLEALPEPPADPDLETFMGLFAPTEALIEQRIDAGEAGDREASLQIEGLLSDAGAEQRAAAAAYGMKDCAEDFGNPQL